MAPEVGLANVAETRVHVRSKRLERRLGHHGPTAFQLTAMLPISMDLRCPIHHLPACASYFVAAWIARL